MNDNPNIPQGEILIYQADNGKIKIDVRVEDETVWLTQQQMADLFQTSRTNVVEHIKHIYEENELDENSGAVSKVILLITDDTVPISMLKVVKLLKVF